MTDQPLIQALIKKENLTPDQAEGVLGLLLSELKAYLTAEQFKLIEQQLPGFQRLISSAPKVKSGFLGGLANSLGGEKGQILMKLSKGLKQLDIPVGQHKSIAHTLGDAVETHYPALTPLMDLG